jgi:hypothetical protein
MIEQHEDREHNPCKQRHVLNPFSGEEQLCFSRKLRPLSAPALMLVNPMRVPKGGADHAEPPAALRPTQPVVSRFEIQGLDARSRSLKLPAGGLP